VGHEAGVGAPARDGLAAPCRVLRGTARLRRQLLDLVPHRARRAIGRGRSAGVDWWSQSVFPRHRRRPDRTVPRSRMRIPTLVLLGLLALATTSRAMPARPLRHVPWGGDPRERRAA